MARTVTLRDIATRARIYADQRQSNGFINDDEMLLMLNDCYCELYDTLVGSYANYFSSTDTITLVAGTVDYSLPADFYKIIGVDFQISANNFCTLMPFPEAERNVNGYSTTAFPAGSIRLRYVPAATTFTSLDDEFDGISGWDRLLSLLVAIDIMDAEESETKPLTLKYQRTLARIMQMATDRDVGMPATVSDIYKTNIWNPYGSLRYRLYGDVIEFLNTSYAGGPTFY